MRLGTRRCGGTPTTAPTPTSPPEKLQVPPMFGSETRQLTASVASVDSTLTHV